MVSYTYPVSFAPSSLAKERIKKVIVTEPYFIISSDGNLVFHISLPGADFPDRKCRITEKESIDYPSSPSKGGNSDLLCDEFLRGAKEAGHEAEKVFLGDLDIRFLKSKTTIPTAISVSTMTLRKSWPK